MILRSSSNPGTANLLSSFSDSPTRDFDTTNLHFHVHRNNFLTKFSSSPVSELNQPKGFRFRRAFSDSNLDKLLKEELNSPFAPNKFHTKSHNVMLRSAPSLSVFHVSDEEKINGGEEEVLTRTVTIGESIEATGSGDFSFGKQSMGLIEEEGEDQQDNEFNGIESLDLEQDKEPVSPPMYLASGLGIDGIDFGGGCGFDLGLPNFEESGDLEEYYKRMVDEYPCHPLFLANYAQVLQSKGELHEAEEYYHRASMADPEDGEILFQYAKLNWQLHHDQHKALTNFERAIRAAPQDSHVLAAYASFLWEINDDVEAEAADASQLKHIGDEEYNNVIANQDFKPLINAPAMDDNNVEEYYKRMVQEYPSNSLLLRNYALFLYQKKRDLRGAEEYYSRAMLADPGDGEIKSRYARLVWEAHRDQDKASSYFEQAVEAAPEDSNVLAAYASFLWEADENEEDSNGQYQFQAAVSAATA